MRTFRRWLLLASGGPLLGAPALAQSPAGTPQAAAAGPSVSGIIIGHYQYLSGGPRKDQNQFGLDRAYLTLRGSPAPRTTYRLTTDVYQAGDGTGWAVRLKYGYVNYEVNAGRAWAPALRLGMLQTVAIEHVEQFWPRWLGTTALDRHGYFSSADVGVAAQLGLPSRRGEVYAHVVNGTGFGRREVDRFKDVGARVSLTPLAAGTSGLWGSLTLTGWAYQGAAASRFAADSVRPVGGSLARDRWGLFAGLRDPRLVLGLEHASRTDASESGANLAASPRVVAVVDGSLTSGFAIVRPMAWRGARRAAPWALVARYDRVSPNDATGRGYHYLLAGTLYDVNARLSVAVDYQEQLGAPVVTPSPLRTWMAHFALNY